MVTKQKLHNRSIKSRLMLMQALMLSVLTLIVGSVSYYIMTAYFQKLYVDKLQADAQIVANLMHSHIGTRTRLLKKIAKSDAAEKYYKSFDALALYELIHEYRDIFPMMTFINLEGNEELKFIRGVMSLDKLLPNSTSRYHELLISPNKLYFDQPRMSPSLKLPVLKTGYQHVNYFGEKIGPVIVDINLHDFSDVINAQNINSRGNIIVTTLNGKIIYATNRSWITEQLSKLPDTNIVAHEKIIRGNVNTRMVAAVESVVAQQPIPELQWHVYVAVPSEIFNAPFVSLRNAVFIASVLLILIGLGLSYLFGRTITAPINRFGQVIDDISSTGDLTKQVDWQGDDELGQLARSFNDMLARLHELNEEVDTERQFSSGVINAMADSLIIVDKDEIIKKVNPATRMLLEIDDSDGFAIPVRTLVPEYTDLISKLQLDGSGYHIQDTVYKTIEGRSIPVILSLSIMHDGDIVLVAKDNTERERVERMKNEFVSMVSHELRTPLTGITGALGLLEGGVVGSLPKETSRLLEIANNNVKRLLSIVNDILDLQKIESGELSFYFQNLQLYPLLQQSLQDHAYFAEDKGIKLVLAHDCIRDGVIYADELRIIQVMNNLLSNAKKFSPKGETVSVSACRYREFLRVSVRDCGPGIPASFKHKVFERFSQADSSDSRINGGTGLGLNIAQKIINKHNGAIGFTTSESAGTMFYFDLPEVRE